MKYLYSVCFLISSIIGANAQYVDSIWKVNHETQNIYSIPLFDSFFIHDTKPYLSQSEEEAYTYTWQEDSILEIIYTKPADNSLWPSLQFNTVRWEGDTSNRFMYNTNGNPVNHSTAYGYHVDMSKETQRMVQFEIQCTESVFILGALVDIEGKKSTEAIVSIPATNGGVDISNSSKWQTITLAWTPKIPANGEEGTMYDEISSSWWNRSNAGIRNPSHAIDSSRIVGFYMFVNPGYFGTALQQKTIYIQNVRIGTYDKNNHWEVYDNTEKTDGIAVFSPQSPFSQKEIPQGIQYTNSFENKTLEIEFLNTTYPNNTEALRIDVTSKTGTTDNYFTTDFRGLPIPHDTIIGTSVNLSYPEQRMIQFQIQTSAPITIQGNLIDITDKVSDRASPETTIPQTPGGIDITNNTKWRTVTLAWDSSIIADNSVEFMDDVYKTQWWNRSNENERNPIHTLDSSRIIGVELIFDPQNSGSLGVHKTIFIRNLGIGNRTSFDIPDITLSIEQQSLEYTLADYYIGADIPQYSIQNDSDNKINVHIQNGILRVTPKTFCENFTNTFVLELTDNSGTYAQEISVTFAKHILTRPNLLLVTGDEQEDLTNIVWEFEQVPYIQHTKIYTEISPGTFSPIAESSYSSSSFYSIANSELSPKSHQFAISSVDICNEESELSNQHTSLFLQIESSENNQIKLVWNSYIGADINLYKILAGNSPDNLIEIAELNSKITEYIGELSQYSVFCVVGVLSEEIESQSTIYSVIRSNIVDTRTEILSPQIRSSLFPNPCTDYVFISSDYTITNILLQNIQGIAISHIQPTELPIQINVQNLSTGMYFIKIEYANNTFDCIQFTKE